MLISLIFWLLLYGTASTEKIPIPTETQTECKISEELLQKGYEAKEGKHYMLFKSEKVWRNHLEANEVCNGLGARLAMVTDHLDLEIVKSYKSQTNESMWVGLVNTYMIECQGVDCSAGDLNWIDGTVADQEDVMTDANVTAWQTKGYCMVMATDKKGVNSIRDRKCRHSLPFLCQYDCNNPYTDTKDITCPEASDEDFEFYYHDHAYISFHFNDDRTFEEAQEKCRSLGASLPTVYSLNKYLGAKIMSGWGAESMWVGLKTADKHVKCNSSLECDGSLLHVVNGDLANGTTDLTFHDSGFINTGLEIDADEGECVVMRNARPPYDTAYTMMSKDCEEAAPFVCSRGCQVECGPPKMVIGVKASNSSQDEIGQSLLLYFDGTMFENIAG